MAEFLNHPWVEQVEPGLFVWRIPEEPTAAELDNALRVIRAWVPSLDGPYGWITDPRALRLKTIAVERKMIADHLRIVEPYSIRYCAGMSTIVTNSMIRGIGTAIAWLYTYPFPVHYSGTLNEALAWVRPRLTTAAPGPRS